MVVPQPTTRELIAYKSSQLRTSVPRHLRSARGKRQVRIAAALGIAATSWYLYQLYDCMYAMMQGAVMAPVLFAGAGAGGQ